MSHALLTIAFAIGAVFGNLLVIQYSWRSRWRATPTGRVLLALFAVIAASYDLSVMALLWPGTFMTGGGEVVRLVARFAIDGVLIGLYVLVVRAQRRDRDAPPSLDDHPDPSPVARRPGRWR